MAGVGSPAITDCPRCRSVCLGPSVLACGHLVCRKCLRQLLQGQAESQCPTCDAVIKPQGRRQRVSPDQFPRDSVMEQMVLEILRRRGCGSHPNSQAKHACVDCGLTLCKSCTNAHRSMATTRSHRLQSLHPAAPATTPGPARRSRAAASRYRGPAAEEAAQWNKENERNQLQDALLQEVGKFEETRARLRQLEGEVQSIARQLGRTKDNLRCGQEILTAYATCLTTLDVTSASEVHGLLLRLRRLRVDLLSSSASDLDHVGGVVKAVQARLDGLLFPNKSPDHGPSLSARDNTTYSTKYRWLPAFLSRRPESSRHKRSNSHASPDSQPDSSFPCSAGPSGSAEPSPTGPGNHDDAMNRSVNPSFLTRHESDNTSSRTVHARASLAARARSRLNDFFTSARENLGLYIVQVFSLRKLAKVFIGSLLCTLLTTIIVVPNKGSHPSWINPYLPPTSVSFDPHAVTPTQLRATVLADCVVNNIAITKDGQLVMPDSDSQRLVIRTTSEDFEILKLQGTPLIATHLYSGLFAVGYPWQRRKFIVVNVDKHAIDWEVKADRSYSGVAPGKDSRTFLAASHPTSDGPARIGVLTWPGIYKETLTDHPALGKMPGLRHLTVSDSELLVSGYKRHILRLNITTGQILGRYQHPLLSKVMQTAVDRAGNIYIASFGKKCIVVRTWDGRWRRLLSRYCDGYQRFTHPIGVAVVDNRLYVVWWNFLADSLLVEYDLSG